MPTYINLSKYATAQRLLSDGTWSADVEAGLLRGGSGRHWTSLTSKGYVHGKLPKRLGGHTILAHRVLWESVDGPLAELDEINHRNGVKHDNRRQNLEVVVHQVNVTHAIDTGLSRVLRGSEHGKAILSEHQVVALFTRAWVGEPYKALAQEFGVSVRHVKQIKCGDTWGHLTDAVPVERRDRGPANHRRFSDETVRLIRSEVAAGAPQKVVAEHYGASRSTVSMIVTRKRFAWVEDERNN